jgi:hypothetical protein
MKKLFVLFLCLMAVAGFVFAGTVHPPGEISLDMTLPGYGAEYRVVTPDTVLVVEVLVVSYSQILTIPAYSGLAGTSHYRMIYVELNTGQGPITPCKLVDYPLLL